VCLHVFLSLWKAVGVMGYIDYFTRGVQLQNGKTFQISPRMHAIDGRNTNMHAFVMKTGEKTSNFRLATSEV